MKTVSSSLPFLLLSLLSFQWLHAQLPYGQTFKNTTAAGLVFNGNAKLTAATGIDPAGDGYLRLTDNTTNQVGYVYAKDAFPSYYGLTTSFEFYTYKINANGYNQADGICFFLFDASVSAFRPGGLGGSLGYAQYYSAKGMTKGYLGIGIDEYGNFSSPSESRNGGPGRKPGSIVVRGPGNGNTASDYPYISGVQTDLAQYNVPFSKFTQRYPDYTSPNYRRIKVVLTPGSSLGANKGFTITVTLFKGGMPTGTEVTLINNFDYPYIAPATLQYGFAASTGSNTDFHEIRNLNIVPTNAALLTNPSAAADNVAVCQGPKALLDVTANDATTNIGGVLNKAAVDLDPATAGIQNAFTDAGKGTYTVDQNGIVTFSANNGFTGISSINYTVNDNYGKTSNAATIKVTVTSSLGPSFTMSNPAGVCAPSTVDITNPSLRSNTTAGSTYTYYSNLTDANNATNNITAGTNAIAASGLYFIRATNGSCYVVQPVTVQVSPIPTTSNAGGTLNLCSPGSTSLNANDPVAGTGAWSQVSGPTTASFISPSFSNSSVSNLQKGAYQFRWTISSGACTASSSDVLVNVANASSAGSNQVLPTTATGTTLQGSDPSPGAGMWTQVSGPAAVIRSPSNPQATVSGLLPGMTYTFKWTVTNGCSTSSQMDVIIPGTLPVRFLSFDARRTEAGNLLSWRTAFEQDNDFFGIEKSNDGSSFAAVGKVAGAGQSGTEKTYGYLDNATATNNTVVYYRIRQVDKSGTATYSTVIKLATDAAGRQMMVWPNPYHNTIHVSASFEAAGQAVLRLFDAAGRLVKQRSYTVLKGENNLDLLLPESGAKGLYLLVLTKGEERFRQVVVRE